MLWIWYTGNIFKCFTHQMGLIASVIKMDMQLSGQDSIRFQSKQNHWKNQACSRQMQHTARKKYAFWEDGLKRQCKYYNLQWGTGRETFRYTYANLSMLCLLNCKWDHCLMNRGIMYKSNKWCLLCHIMPNSGCLTLRCHGFEGYRGNFSKFSRNKWIQLNCEGI